MNRPPILHGGMYRCCIQEVEQFDGISAEGAETKCSYCNATLRVTSRGWEYVGDSKISTEPK